MTKKYAEEEDLDAFCEHETTLCDTEEEEDDLEEERIAPQSMYELPSEVNEIVEYTTLYIGIASLVVSSDGMIRKKDDIFSTSAGYALPGTPYRTYMVEIEKGKMEEYFVHDLVWRAFYGEPPEGWEVRHSFWEAKKGTTCYDNSLESLQIYPSTVVYLPSVRKCLLDAY